MIKETKLCRGRPPGVTQSVRYFAMLREVSCKAGTSCARESRPARTTPPHVAASARQGPFKDTSASRIVLNNTAIATEGNPARSDIAMLTPIPAMPFHSDWGATITTLNPPQASHAPALTPPQHWFLT